MSAQLYFCVLRPAKNQLTVGAFENVNYELFPRQETDGRGWTAVGTDARLSMKPVPQHPLGKSKL
jgi:hypothetical protein